MSLSHEEQLVCRMMVFQHRRLPAALDLHSGRMYGLDASAEPRLLGLWRCSLPQSSDDWLASTCGNVTSRAEPHPRAPPATLRRRGCLLAGCACRGGQFIRLNQGQLECAIRFWIDRTRGFPRALAIISPALAAVSPGGAVPKNLADHPAGIYHGIAGRPIVARVNV